MVGRTSRAKLLRTLAVAAVAACSAPRLARADDGAAVRTHAHAWFDGERRSGWLWGGVGLLSLGAATGLHRFGAGSDVERGMAYPIGAFGVLQTAIGVGSLLRGSGRADELDALVLRSPEEARRREIDRMRTLRQAFLAIEIVEALVVVGAAGYAATRTSPGQERSRGVGLGLAMEGGAMLLLDGIAAARASVYAGQLDAISLSVAPAAGGRGLSLVGSFLRGIADRKEAWRETRGSWRSPRSRWSHRLSFRVAGGSGRTARPSSSRASTPSVAIRAPRA